MGSTRWALNRRTRAYSVEVRVQPVDVLLAWPGLSSFGVPTVMFVFLFYIFLLAQLPISMA